MFSFNYRPSIYLETNLIVSMTMVLTIDRMTIGVWQKCGVRPTVLIRILYSLFIMNTDGREHLWKSALRMMQVVFSVV